MCRQTWCQLRNSLLSVVGLAGDQQPLDGLVMFGGLCFDRVRVGDIVFDQCHATATGVISRQPFSIAKDQPHRQACARQSRRPQSAQTSRAENMPCHRHQ